RVLAVDDDEDALSLVRDTLEGAGASVETAQSAADALRAIEANLPHVLISDLSLPSVDGLAMIQQLRASADPRIRALPAAALTAYARSQDRTAAANAGF